jgi:hypothetical protein
MEPVYLRDDFLTINDTSPKYSECNNHDYYLIQDDKLIRIHPLNHYIIFSVDHSDALIIPTCKLLNQVANTIKSI